MSIAHNGLNSHLPRHTGDHTAEFETHIGHNESNLDHIASASSNTVPTKDRRADGLCEALFLNYSGIFPLCNRGPLDGHAVAYYTQKSLVVGKDT